MKQHGRWTSLWFELYPVILCRTVHSPKCPCSAVHIWFIKRSSAGMNPRVHYLVYWLMCPGKLPEYLALKANDQASTNKLFFCELDQGCYFEYCAGCSACRVESSSMERGSKYDQETISLFGAKKKNHTSCHHIKKTAWFEHHSCRYLCVRRNDLYSYQGLGIMHGRIGSPWISNFANTHQLKTIHSPSVVVFFWFQFKVKDLWLERCNHAPDKGESLSIRIHSQRKSRYCCELWT